MSILLKETVGTAAGKTVILSGTMRSWATGSRLIKKLLLYRATYGLGTGAVFDRRDVGHEHQHILFDNEIRGCILKISRFCGIV